MCEQGCENKKLVITKFSGFLQARNSNFRVSANRAYERILSFVAYSMYVMLRQVKQVHLSV